jgi:hypothetical protein
MGTLATSARNGTTAEAPGPTLTDRLSLALPKGAGVDTASTTTEEEESIESIGALIQDLFH